MRGAFDLEIRRSPLAGRSPVPLRRAKEDPVVALPCDDLAVQVHQQRVVREGAPHGGIAEEHDTPGQCWREREPRSLSPPRSGAQSVALVYSDVHANTAVWETLRLGSAARLTSPRAEAFEVGTARRVLVRQVSSRSGPVAAAGAAGRGVVFQTAVLVLRRSAATSDQSSPSPLTLALRPLDPALRRGQAELQDSMNEEALEQQARRNMVDQLRDKLPEDAHLLREELQDLQVEAAALRDENAALQAEMAELDELKDLGIARARAQEEEARMETQRGDIAGALSDLALERQRVRDLARQLNTRLHVEQLLTG